MVNPVAKNLKRQPLTAIILAIIYVPETAGNPRIQDLCPEDGS